VKPAEEQSEEGIATRVVPQPALQPPLLLRRLPPRTPTRTASLYAGLHARAGARGGPEPCSPYRTPPLTDADAGNDSAQCSGGRQGIPMGLKPLPLCRRPLRAQGKGSVVTASGTRSEKGQRQDGGGEEEELGGPGGGRQSKALT